MPDFDTAWKEALDAYFEPFMAFFFADAHREIEWSRGVEMLDKELQQISPESERGRRVADKLARVRRTNGHEEWILVHIEVQSQREREFAERMFVYNYRLFDRYNRKVASFAILAWKEILDFEKEKSMPFLTGADIVGREEALAEGLAEGLAKGRKEGREEGRHETRELLVASIEAMLDIKFAAPGLALLPEIRQIDDLALLGKIVQDIKQADSPEALRRLWTNA
jgi:hypothetical protein